MSSAYRSLHINTSRERMEYSDYPMPNSYPDFPHHTHIAEYFDDYVDHFGFRDRIVFETGVKHARRDDDGGWTVSLDTGETRARYDALLVANGHHWDPRWPEPQFPGHFDGVEMHSHHYIENTDFRDRTCSWSGSATARWTSPSSPASWRARRSSPLAVGPTSFPSTCSAGRWTRSGSIR